MRKCLEEAENLPVGKFLRSITIVSHKGKVVGRKTFMGKPQNLKNLTHLTVVIVKRKFTQMILLLNVIFVTMFFVSNVQT